MKKTQLRLLSAAMLAGFSGVASASAFQLLEQNASGLGVAYAGSAAVADNAATIFYNPAGMTQLKGRQVSVGLVAIGPSYEFRNEGSSGTGLLTPAVVGSTGGDAGGWAVVPNAYVSWQLTPELFGGLGVSAPFGLKTEYDDNSWVGRFQSLKSEVKTINLNPSLAYRASDTVSLGVGINYQQIKAEMTSMTPLGKSMLKGDDHTWGWNVGALFTLSPAMRVGVAYRSAMDYTLTGNQSVGTTVIPASAKLKLPDTFTVSVWQQLSDRWESMGDLSYTAWSKLGLLNVVRLADSRIIGAESFAYKDTWRLAWGAAYKYADDIKLKFGLAADRTPTRDTTRTARVPDNNRIWLSFGAQWKPGKDTVVDAGYTYLYVKDPAIAQTTVFRSPTTGAVIGTSTLRGHYDDSCHIVGVQFSQNF